MPNTEDASRLICANISAIVVEDSEPTRMVLVEILKSTGMKVLEAANGEEALQICKEKKNHVSIVFTDYQMPVINGIELTKKIRERYGKDKISIIAISGQTTSTTMEEFLDAGANDFINKPFSRSEIIARVKSNLDLLNLFKKITEIANRDFMTGAYNRRYFFDVGESILSRAIKKKKDIAVIMLDIDGFKKINDTYGHSAGDEAIKVAHEIVKQELRKSDLIARFGGEEFCVILKEVTKEEALVFVERIRQKFENNVIKIKTIEIKYTVSFGVAYGLLSTLDEMVAVADDALYESKNSGKNKNTLRIAGIKEAA